MSKFENLLKKNKIMLIILLSSKKKYKFGSRGTKK